MDRTPAFFVLGAFGAGKSTLAPLVARQLPECLVLDVDWLLSALSALAGHDLTEDRQSWPRIRHVWLTLADISARAGRLTVFFSPAEPDEIESLPSRGLIGETHWLLLDCADEELQRRLGERTNWPEQDTFESLADARRYRTLGPKAIRTDDTLPGEAAGLVVDWVRVTLT